MSAVGFRAITVGVGWGVVAGLDEAGAALRFAYQRVERAAEFVTQALKVCEDYAAALSSGGFGRASHTLTCSAGVLRNKVQARLQDIAADAADAVAELSAADVADLDTAAEVVATCQVRLAGLRGSIKNADSSLLGLITILLRMGSRSRTMVEHLRQAHDVLAEVIGHHGTAVKETDRAASAIGDSDRQSHWEQFGGFGGGPVPPEGAVPRNEIPKKRVSPQPLDLVSTVRRRYIGENDPACENPPFGKSTVRYMPSEIRERSRLFFRSGRLFWAYDGTLVHTCEGESLHRGVGNAIFVMDEHGNFYASTKQEIGEFHHSSFFAGGPVAGAGEFDVQYGQLVRVTRSSGHYQPDVQQHHNVKRLLAEQGVDVGCVRFDQGF